MVEPKYYYCRIALERGRRLRRRKATITRINLALQKATAAMPCASTANKGGVCPV
jgi:hypothetical protein